MSYINLHCTDVETWAEAKFLARLDYELNLGQELQVSAVVVWIGNDTHDLGGPWQVRLDATCCSGDLENSTGEFLDPYWEFTALEPMDGRSPWGHGPSYRVLEAARDRME